VEPEWGTGARKRKFIAGITFPSYVVSMAGRTDSHVADRKRSLKSLVKGAIRAFADIPIIARVVYKQNVGRWLKHVPGIRSIYGIGWDRVHPFDLQYGTDTSGYSGDEERISGTAVDIHAHGYAGTQPGLLRGVLATLPRPETCTFVDIGCGKGRPLLVATEFPFKDIVGVELSPALTEIARQNAEKIAKLFPLRTPVRVVCGDAAAYPLPAGDVILFLYNPFEEILIRKVVVRIEEALAAERRRIFILYFNPIFGACFDASPALARRFAKMVTYAKGELGFGPGAEDAVVIWQGGDVPPMDTKSDAKIVRTGLRSVQLVG
jgi:SAM-dependent methyltransferase